MVDHMATALERILSHRQKRRAAHAGSNGRKRTGKQCSSMHSQIILEYVSWLKTGGRTADRLLHQATRNDMPVPSTLARPPRPFRKISFTETLSSASSIHEQTNLFYPLRRQFIARPGSRSESNRILIVELCLALEEFHNALSRLWLNRQASFDPRTSTKRTSPPHPSLTDPRLPMLAAEVTSLITEIVEAVPSFSYALAQGNYGPVPFSMGNLAVKLEESSLDNYLERISIINVPDGDAVSFDDWWPARLRLDLTDGLLADKAEDSPTLAMHGLNVFGSEDMSRVDSDSDRTDQLLAEGRRRWQEYKQAQSQGL